LRKHSTAAAILLVALAALLGSCRSAAADETPPDKVTLSQVGLFNSESEVVNGIFPGLLLIPNARPNYRDEKYHQPYHLACHVYVAVPSPEDGSELVYRRRFLICAAGPDALDFTRNVARFLLLLYGERRDRIRDDHPLNLPTVNVWLTERVESGLSPDTGGEEFQNQIYLYNIHRERPAIEWAREIAHEYGHYALPGISGFKEPEEWANGVLGERLFLKWIRDDIRGGRVKPEDVAFVTNELLDDFYAHAIWPLIRRIMREGIDPRMIAGTKRDAMDYYTGLALYVDTLYGTRGLVEAIQDTHSASPLTFPRASDFLTGVLRSLRGQKDFTLTLPNFGGGKNEHSIRFYLPAGSWSVEREGGTISWTVAPDPAAGLTSTARLVVSRKGGWRRLAYYRAPDAAVAARLTFRKRE
jgi:hypothetical protein